MMPLIWMAVMAPVLFTWAAWLYDEDNIKRKDFDKRAKTSLYVVVLIGEVSLAACLMIDIYMKGGFA